MDTRSSSGSGSNGNPTNNSHTQASQQATYTTAGTIFNPQTAPPLQPPARRGRATRWPPAAPTDLSAFSNGVVGAIPRSRYRSPPTTASTLRHYTPLQQNHDRAMDPTQRTPTSLSNPRRTTSEDSSTMSLPNTLQFNNQNGGPGSDGSLQDEDEGSQFINLSTKTLTNLAAYPNPSQKAAQKCLDRARETINRSSHNSRPTSPGMSRPGYDGAGASASVRGAVRDNFTHYSSVPRNVYTTNSTRSSMLSNGPGAPQPLTAGPPGQRQYQASTLQGPIRALQESAQNPFSSDMSESFPSTNHPSRPGLNSLGRQLYTTTSDPPRTVQQDMRPSTSQYGHGSPQPAEHTVSRDAPMACEAVPHHSTVREGKGRWAAKIRETRTQEQVSHYYKEGPIRDYNGNGIVSVPEDNSDLQFSRHRASRSLFDKDMDTKRHRARLYAGTDVFKTFEERYQQIRQEARDRELGRLPPPRAGTLSLADIDATIDYSQLGKARPISDDVLNNQLEKSHAAQLLLGMTLTTLFEDKKRRDVISEPQKPKATIPCHKAGYVGLEWELADAAYAAEAAAKADRASSGLSMGTHLTGSQGGRRW